MKVLFDYCFHTTITDVQYSRQLADSYSSVLSVECIDAIAVLSCYGSPRPAPMRFILHRFSFFFKGTAPLIDTNIWQCLLTILPLQCWTDFRRFTPSFVSNLIIIRCSTLTCTFVSLIFLTTDKTTQQQTPVRWITLELSLHLPHITTFYGFWSIFELRTNYNSCLPSPRTCCLLHVLSNYLESQDSMELAEVFCLINRFFINCAVQKFWTDFLKIEDTWGTVHLLFLKISLLLYIQAFAPPYNFWKAAKISSFEPF
jgi:hypothetical protein